MTRDLETERTPDEASATQSAPQQGSALAPHIHRALMAIRPGDYAGLALLVRQYPQQRQQILEEAAQSLGNSTVQRALAFTPAAGSAPKDGAGLQAFREENGTVGRPPKDDAGLQAFREEDNAPAVGRPPKDDAGLQAFREEDNAPAVGRPPKDDAGLQAFREEDHPVPARFHAPSAADRNAATAVVREDDAAIKHPASVDPATAPDPTVTASDPIKTDAAPAPKESAWVIGARTYNSHHAALSTEFNSLTTGSCVNADGELDPNKVAEWQVANGVAPDGRIGPHTIAAARKKGGGDPVAAPSPAASVANSP
jgi:hypothetical protein